jgi:parallel beta helix pectate lyase-like protein
MVFTRNEGRVLHASLALTALVVAMSQSGCGDERPPAAEEAARASTQQVASVLLPPTVARKPAAPTTYRVPRHAVRVSSSAQLRSALSDHRSDAIVLADGTYDNGSSFSDREGDRLYAAHLGRAVLRAGVVLGANDGPSGAALRGIRFDVDDPAKTFEGSIVHVWGSAKHAAIRDTWLDGNGVVDAGLVVRQPEGFVAQRVVARAFRGYGVLVDPNQDHYRAHAPYMLEDLAISQVMRPVPGSSDGTAEACLWLGSTGTLRRARVRSCGVSGIWTGSANTGSHVQDVAVDRTPVGIYIEHFTTGTTFRRLRIGPNVDRGVNAEWANHALSGKPASVDNVIESCYFHTRLIGVYFDEGTTRTVVRRCTFVGQSRAAIGDYKGIDNRYYGNDFSGIAPGAVRVSYQHGAQ